MDPFCPSYFSLSLVCPLTDLVVELWHIQLNMNFGVDANTRLRIVWHNLQLTAFSTDWGSIVKSKSTLNKHLCAECLWFDRRASF